MAKSIGHGGQGELTDALVFQGLFNLNLPHFPGTRRRKLATDGRIGPATIQAIERFET